MREAVGNSLVMGMVASIIGVIMIFFVGSISYSKAYKVKNKIINIIEENNGWDDSLNDEINVYLKEVGYQVGAGAGNKECDESKIKPGGKIVYCKNITNGYNYCVIRYGSTDESNKDTYYKVITYMHFELPVIGSALKFPVKGETKTFGYFNGNA